MNCERCNKEIKGKMTVKTPSNLALALGEKVEYFHSRCHALEQKDADIHNLKCMLGVNPSAR